jgi:hypothetical protein
MLDYSGKISFYFGEVVNVDSAVTTYHDSKTEALFSIDVLIVEHNNEKVITAIPANINNKHIPLIGETVLLFQGYDKDAKFFERYRQWYYLSTVSIRSAINHNILPVNSTETELDSKVPERYIAPLQPYRGDIMHEGRWGNSIRLGSTLAGDGYSTQPTWQGAAAGDPIIILTNRSTHEPKTFSVENINTDASSLYLTSTQQLTELKTNNDIFGIKVTEFNTSQLIGTADRIILTSKNDVIALDSLKNIQLLAPKIFIGNNSKYEGMVQSTKLVDILNKIIRVINIGFKDSSGATSTPIDTSLQTVDLSDLTSNEIFISEWRNVNL